MRREKGQRSPHVLRLTSHSYRFNLEIAAPDLDK